jgi:hypothetical protein
MVPNKPNSRRGRMGWGLGGTGRRVLYKQTQFRPGARPRYPHDSSIPSFYPSSPTAIVRNKPNFGQPGWHPGVDRAKQTQFAPGQTAGPWLEQFVRNKPNLPLEGVGRGRPTHEEPPGEVIVPNKPNFQRGRVGWGRSCQTKPILARPRGTGILPVVQNHGQDAHATGPVAEFVLPWADRGVIILSVCK